MLTGLTLIGSVDSLCHPHRAASAPMTRVTGLLLPAILALIRSEYARKGFEVPVQPAAGLARTARRVDPARRLDAGSVLAASGEACGIRDIDIDLDAATALCGYHTLKARQKLAAGPNWPDTGLFFTRPDGHPWHPDAVTIRFHQLVADADLPPLRLHDLRHCTATYLKATGADLKTIQETLGHSSITITADTYTSVLLDLERESANAAANLIPRKSRKTA